MAYQEKQLGQLRPANTTAASIYSPAASTTAIIKSFVVCNTTAIPADFRIFIDDDGTTYDQSTALFYDAQVMANDTVLIDTFWPMDDSTGNTAVRTSIANALTFTVFGVEVTT